MSQSTAVIAGTAAGDLDALHRRPPRHPAGGLAGEVAARDPQPGDRVAILCALGSAACFVAGLFPLGGPLFLLRFFVDCLDGKVARAQGTSRRGAPPRPGRRRRRDRPRRRRALLDAAASQRRPRAGAGRTAGAMVFYNWVLAYRKHSPAALGLGDGGADHTRQVVGAGRTSMGGVCRQLNMSPVPWALEAEIGMLGLARSSFPPSGSASAWCRTLLLPARGRGEHASTVAACAPDRRGTKEQGGTMTRTAETFCRESTWSSPRATGPSCCASPSTRSGTRRTPARSSATSSSTSATRTSPSPARAPRARSAS